MVGGTPAGNRIVTLALFYAAVPRPGQDRKLLICAFHAGAAGLTLLPAPQGSPIEVGRLKRRVVDRTADEVGLPLAEGKHLVSELQRLVPQTQMEACRGNIDR
jgi:hypothetical protein